METSEPLYVQLKETIIQDIKTGTLRPGDRLPSQREMCQMFHVSHMTIRRVIVELVNEGVIYAIPGKGLYVHEHKNYAETSMLGFTREMTARGFKTTSQILEKGLLYASTVIASALNITTGSELVFLKRLRFINGEPISLQHSYLVHRHCLGILDLIDENASLFSILQEVYRLPLVNITTTVEATLAHKNQANLLNLKLPAALLMIEQINGLDLKQPLEYTRLAYRGDKYVMQTKTG